jgi:isochorismate hydrolase
MHDFTMPQAVIDRVTARAGRAHPFDVIDPARAALMVVDMQNYFVKPGYQGEVPAAGMWCGSRTAPTTRPNPGPTCTTIC